MELSDTRRLKTLEAENAKLKKMLAEQMMDVTTLKEMLGKKLLKPNSRRNAVDWAMKTKGYNQRRACALAGIDPRVYRRTSSRPQDTALRARMKGLASERRRFGYPDTIRVDQGSEFILRDMDLWAYQRGVTLDFSRPGKPTDNAFMEAFSGRFRAECLNSHWFMSLADAAEKLEAWRRDYNEERSHSAIGHKVLADLMKSAHDTSPCT